jgi:hypothetical protein
MQIGRRTQLQRDDTWRDLADSSDTGSAVPELYHEHDPASGGKEALIERSDFFIRLATSHGHRRQGSMLVRRMYSCRGYEIDGRSGIMRGNEFSLQSCGPQGVSAPCRCGSTRRTGCWPTSCTASKSMGTANAALRSAR